MSQSPSGSSHEPRKPPIPKFVYKILNPTISVLLRSPLHGLLDRHLTTITFTGRKSGRRISTPVGYSREGNTLTMLVQGPWWKNLRGGAPVTVRLEGRECEGYATATDDPAELLPFMRKRIAEMGSVRRARRMGLRDLDPNREPTDDELLYAIRGAALVKVELR